LRKWTEDGELIDLQPLVFDGLQIAYFSSRCISKVEKLPDGNPKDLVGRGMRSHVCYGRIYPSHITRLNGLIKIFENIFNGLDNRRAARIAIVANQRSTDKDLVVLLL
jgi:hypothetical protein